MWHYDAGPASMRVGAETLKLECWVGSLVVRVISGASEGATRGVDDPEILPWWMKEVKSGNVLLQPRYPAARLWFQRVTSWVACCCPTATTGGVVPSHLSDIFE